MHVMGADFNAESALTLLDKARQFRPNQKAAKRVNIKLAIAEIEGAIGLLARIPRQDPGSWWDLRAGVDSAWDQGGFWSLSVQPGTIPRRPG